MKVERLTEIKKLIDRAGEMPDALALNLHEWFRVELTYTSNALEGNTLTRRETAMVVEKGITVGGKSLVEHLEATNQPKPLIGSHKNPVSRLNISPRTIFSRCTK